MTRYVPPTDKAAIFPEGGKPYNRVYFNEFDKAMRAGYTPIVMSPFGPVPAELDEIYPLAQSLFPEITDAETVSESDNLTFDFIERMGFKEVIEYDEIPEDGTMEYDPDVIRAKAIANYQFGVDVADAMFRGKIDIVKSRKTGKIRNVISDGEHILSLRAGDGLYTLRPEGAVRILERIPSPRMRVIVNDDSVPFVSEGRNAFAQFVLDADDEIRPMEEVIVVDKDDKFLATGRALLIKSEMKSLKKGIAVKVRTGSGDEA